MEPTSSYARDIKETAIILLGSAILSPEDSYSQLIGLSLGRSDRVIQFIFVICCSTTTPSVVSSSLTSEDIGLVLSSS
jgi:hypothetical protein